jgi:hypothetical protein
MPSDATILESIAGSSPIHVPLLAKALLSAFAYASTSTIVK